MLVLLLAGWMSSAEAVVCLTLYGNWCGPGHPPAGSYPPPIDAFDAACMRHDICTTGLLGNSKCDARFVYELHGLAAKYGFLPRPLQWAEYAIRVKAGGPWGGMPAPLPGDALGLLGSLAVPCW
jgi:hypothetical protein